MAHTACMLLLDSPSSQTTSNHSSHPTYSCARGWGIRRGSKGKQSPSFSVREVQLATCVHPLRLNVLSPGAAVDLAFAPIYCYDLLLVAKQFH
jgi:hypothetical protein